MGTSGPPDGPLTRLHVMRPDGISGFHGSFCVTLLWQLSCSDGLCGSGFPGSVSASFLPDLQISSFYDDYYTLFYTYN